MEYKDVTAELKTIDDKGEGILRFIRFHQQDKDADITLPGFIGQQQAVLIASHNWKSDYPPLGRGESFEADGATNFRFRLNLDDPRGKQWYSWLKMDRGMGNPLQQISYGFSPHADGQERKQQDGKPIRLLKPRPDGTPGAVLHELSFVTVGSGNDQGVLAIKAYDDLPEPEFLDGSFDDLKAAGVQVQSLIFPKRHWDSAEAVRSWLSSHDYSTTLDTTEGSYRARQKPPGDFQRLRSFCINPSREASAESCRVMAVGGPMKESRSHDAGLITPAGHWAVGVHHTETDLKAWDTPIQVQRIHPTGAPGYFRQIFAAQNPQADLTSKQSFAFPHHVLSADGEPGAASVRACAEGLHVLERWWAGMLPADDLKAIHAHLASHLRDAQRDPPELRGLGDARYPLDAQIELVLWKLEEVLHQVDHVRDMRSRKGMALTEPRLHQIDQLQKYFTTLCALVKIKQLDRPSEAVLEELSAEARAEAFGRRIEEMRAKAVKDAKATEAAEIAKRVQRWEARQRA